MTLQELIEKIIIKKENKNFRIFIELNKSNIKVTKYFKQWFYNMFVRGVNYV